MTSEDAPILKADLTDLKNVFFFFIFLYLKLFPSDFFFLLKVLIIKFRSYQVQRRRRM